MNKRIVVVICIIVAAVSFMGGMVYGDRDATNIVEWNFEKSKFTYDFTMSIDLETASTWLDWAIEFHQRYVDSYIDTERVRKLRTSELRALKSHQASIDKYEKIKTIFIEYDEEWEKE